MKETEGVGEKVLCRARGGKDTLSNLDQDNNWIRNGERQTTVRYGGKGKFSLLDVESCLSFRRVSLF